jgi:hypothetical protein
VKRFVVAGRIHAASQAPVVVHLAVAAEPSG